MASSSEMLAGSMALLVGTFINFLMYMLGNSILGPLLQIFNSFRITPLLSLSENGWIIQWYFYSLLLLELGMIGAFIVIVGRRQISGSEYL